MNGENLWLTEKPLYFACLEHGTDGRCDMGKISWTEAVPGVDTGGG